MSVEAAVGAGIGTAIGTAIGPAVGPAVGASFGAEIGSMASIASGFSTTFSPEILSGGLNKPIGLTKIMENTVPYQVSSDSLNPDRVVPVPRMVFNDKLFSTMAMPKVEPTISEFRLPESLKPIELETRPVLVDTLPVEEENNPVVAETIADQKFSQSLTADVAQLFHDEPISQTFWARLVERALPKTEGESVQEKEASMERSAKPVIVDIYEPRTEFVGLSTEPTLKLTSQAEAETATEAAAKAETENVSEPETAVVAAVDSADENTPPPTITAEKNQYEPEEEIEPEVDETIWNRFRLHQAWRTAKKSLTRRAGLGRAIVSSAFSQKYEVPAVEIAAEAALLDLPGVYEHKEIIRGRLDYPTIQHEVVLSATAAGTSYAEADKAVQTVIYQKAPRERHDQQVFEAQEEQSKLIVPVRVLAEEGAKVIALRKRKRVWEATKRRTGIEPIEFERAPQKAA